MFFRDKATERSARAAAYKAQRRSLEAEHLRTGKDVFVSPFDVLKDATGNEVSYGTWPEGVHSWLPRADCIAFTSVTRGRRWFLLVRWADVRVICPDALKRIPDVTPARFETVTWPNADALGRLDIAAILRK